VGGSGSANVPGSIGVRSHANRNTAKSGTSNFAELARAMIHLRARGRSNGKTPRPPSGPVPMFAGSYVQVDGPNRAVSAHMAPVPTWPTIAGIGGALVKVRGEESRGTPEVSRNATAGGDDREVRDGQSHARVTGESPRLPRCRPPWAVRSRPRRTSGVRWERGPRGSDVDGCGAAERGGPFARADREVSGEAPGDRAHRARRGARRRRRPRHRGPARGSGSAG